MPELTEAVEEIEIASIVEIAGKIIDESSGWLPPRPRRIDRVRRRAGRRTDRGRAPPPARSGAGERRTLAAALEPLMGAVVHVDADASSRAPWRRPPVLQSPCRGVSRRCLALRPTAAGHPECCSAAVAIRWRSRSPRTPPVPRRRMGALGSARRRDSDAGAAADRHLHRDAACATS